MVRSGHERGQGGGTWGRKKPLNQESKYLGFVAVSATNCGKSLKFAGFSLFVCKTDNYR